MKSDHLKNRNITEITVDEQENSINVNYDQTKRSISEIIVVGIRARLFVFILLNFANERFSRF